jgi:hypothetical protein
MQTKWMNRYYHRMLAVRLDLLLPGPHLAMRLELAAREASEVTTGRGLAQRVAAEREDREHKLEAQLYRERIS